MKNPSALKSAPFWILLVASVGVAAYGVQAATRRIAAMEAGLTDGSATTAQVYGGQSWVVLESILAGAGIVGVLIAFAVWALGPRAVAAAPVEPAQASAYGPVAAEPSWREQSADVTYPVTPQQSRVADAPTTTETSASPLKASEAEKTEAETTDAEKTTDRDAETEAPTSPSLTR
jgi:hypothetical protein